MSSGDGWTICDAGHRHWGVFGAAGLLIADHERVILQHRASWTHEGGSWGIPGGARNSEESAVQAALREAHEEAGIEPADVEPLALFLADHGNWTYTTVLARPRRGLRPHAANEESVSIEWVARNAVHKLPLHSGFAQAWPHLQLMPEPVLICVAPGVGSAQALAQLVAQGISAAALPSGINAGRLDRILVDLKHVADADAASEHIASLPSGAAALVLLEPSDLARIL